jgi:hypothetical protein
MYTLCEADIERGAALSPPTSDIGDKESRERDRIAAAIRRTKSAIYSVEFALLEFHALIRRSAVEARFEPQNTTIPEQSGKDEGIGNENEGKQSYRNISTNNSLDSLDPKKQSCAWVVSTRAPLTQKEAFDSVVEVLESLKRHSQYSEPSKEDGEVGVEKAEDIVKTHVPATRAIFTQSSPSRRSKVSTVESTKSIFEKVQENLMTKPPTPEHFREEKDEKIKKKLRRKLFIIVFFYCYYYFIFVNSHHVVNILN